MAEADTLNTPSEDGDDGLSRMLSNILSDPAMMSAISGMASKLKSPQSDTEDEPQSAPAEPAEASPVSAGDIQSAVTALAPLLSGIGGKSFSRGGENSRRDALLCALKPYLSPVRCEAIDYILKISRVSGVIKGLNAQGKQ